MLGPRISSISYFHLTVLKTVRVQHGEIPPDLDVSCTLRSHRVLANKHFAELIKAQQLLNSLVNIQFDVPIPE